MEIYMSALRLFHSRFTQTCLTFSLLVSGLQAANAGVLELTESLSLPPTPCIHRALTTPNGKFTYATAFCEETLFVMGRDLATGKLTKLDALVGDEDTGLGLRYVDSLALSPNGKFVFVFGKTGKNHDAANPYRSVIFVYQIDADTGLLTFKFEYQANADREITISPDGNYLYLLSQQKIEVVRVATNGQLSYVQDLSFSGTATSLTFNPDASLVYLSFYNANKIAIYDRDTATGQLSNVRAASIPGVYDGAPAVSPDGKHLYSFVNDELTQFSIAEDGSLTSTASIAKPPAQVAAKFYCPTNMIISPNGRLVYFVDSCADNMQAWLRDTGTGALTFAGFNDADDLDIPDNAFQQTEHIGFTPDYYFSTAAFIYGITTMELTADTHISGVAPATVMPGDLFSVTIDVGNLGGAVAHQLAINLSGSALESVKSINVSHPSGECRAVDSGYLCKIPELVKGAAETIELELVAPAVFSDALQLVVTKDQAEIDKNTTNDERVFAIAKGVGSSSSSAVASSSPSSVATSSATVSSSVASSAPASGGGSSSGGGGSVALLLLLGLSGLAASRRAKGEK